MKIKIIFYPILLLVSTFSFSQVGIGTTSPHASALLDITSTNKGLLPPRVTCVEKNAIVGSFSTNPSESCGLVVWCTDCGENGELQVFDGSLTWSNATGGLGSNYVIQIPSIDANHATFANFNLTVSNIKTSSNAYGGTIFNRGYCLSTSPNPTYPTNDYGSAFSVSSYAVGGEYWSGTLPYLSNNTTYYVRFYVLNPAGNPTYSKQNSFTTTSSEATFGINYTNHYNGVTTEGAYPYDVSKTSHQDGQAFSSYTNCQTATISGNNMSCPTSVTGASGTVYPVKNINGQCWMARDLNEIPSNYPTNSSTWSTSTDTGNYGYYNYSVASGTSGWGEASSTYSDSQGLLYQRKAAMNGSTSERAQGACPSGYHVPSDCEWSFLEHGLGMSTSQNGNVSYNTYRDADVSGGYTGGKVATKLFSSDTSSDGSNATVFSGFYNGNRLHTTGAFQNGTGTTLQSHYWTSSAFNSGTTMSVRRFIKTSSGVVRTNLNAANAIAVRCLKD